MVVKVDIQNNSRTPVVKCPKAADWGWQGGPATTGASSSTGAKQPICKKKGSLGIHRAPMAFHGAEGGI